MVQECVVVDYGSMESGESEVGGGGVYISKVCEGMGYCRMGCGVGMGVHLGVMRGGGSYRGHWCTMWAVSYRQYPGGGHQRIWVLSLTTTSLE